jgi:hypothetical protein
MMIVVTLSKLMATLSNIKPPPVKLSTGEQPSHLIELLMVLGFSLQVLLSKLFISYAFSLSGGSIFDPNAMIQNAQNNPFNMNHTSMQSTFLPTI